MSSSIYSRLKKNLPRDNSFKSKNKYNAVKQKVAGRTFDSGYENEVYHYLKILELSGCIRFLRQQCTITFDPYGIRYRADFEIEEKLDTGEWSRVLVEAKGVELPEWKLKLKLYRYRGPCPLWIFKGYERGSPKLVEIVIPKAD